MTTIIADVGSNWRDLSTCISSIGLAQASGADIVKFQFYNHNDLYGTPGKMKNELPEEWLPKLKEHSDKIGIEFMCTAFSPIGVKIVDPYVKRHKIAASEASCPGMIDAVKATEKPFIISLADPHEETIGDIIRNLEKNYTKEIVFMYCSPAYPSTEHDLRWIDKYYYSFDSYLNYVGYSDHSIDIFTPFAACRDYGAEYLEKHFNVGFTDTPDSGPYALHPDQFRRMVDLIRGVKKIENAPSEHNFRLTRRCEESAWKRRKIGDI